MSDCQECGMWVDPKYPYHPYAACLMFKGCHDGKVVQANLDGVIAHGAQYESGFDDLADRYAALEARCRDLQQHHDWAAPQVTDHGADVLRIAQLEAALRSIAANTCCGSCQEAARVAASALETACEHVFSRIGINNAKHPNDPPEMAYTPYKCTKCGMYESEAKTK